MKKSVLILLLFLGFNLTNAQEITYTPLTEYKVESFQTSLITKKMMFDWFGKWDKVAYTKNNDIILIWTNRKIINEANETFMIITSSKENEDEMYGTIQILSSNNQDALVENSPYREYLTEFLKTISKQENKNKKFYKEYLKVEY